MSFGVACLCDGRDDVRCDAAHCDIAGEGRPGDRNSCRVCWLRLGGDKASARKPAGLGDAVSKALSAVGVTEERVSSWLGRPCGCAERREKLNALGAWARSWLAGGGASRDQLDDMLSWPVRHDEKTLWPGVPGKRFNAGLIEYEGGYLLAARNGWAGSEVYLGRLDREFRPVGEPWRLGLRVGKAANYGAEDPRLFLHAGRVHVAYVGVEGTHRIERTNVLYARLATDLTVERVFAPRVAGRRPWEKNWSFFSHDDGSLYAVYTVRPHKVIRVVGDAVPASLEVAAPQIPWQGGDPRGGAPPARVGDEYWHFFHDRVEGGKGRASGKWTYRTALYAFEARPPFRPTRYVPEPLLVADARTRPGDQYAAVVFTCGAVRQGGDKWVLSSGIHDRWLELHRLDHAELERRMVTL